MVTHEGTGSNPRSCTTKENWRNVNRSILKSHSQKKVSAPKKQNHFFATKQKNLNLEPKFFSSSFQKKLFLRLTKKHFAPKKTFISSLTFFDWRALKGRQQVPDLQQRTTKVTVGADSTESGY